MKKIGIMQPYFFPYIGYFSLIKATDEFILFDTVQFIRHGWIERNRVLKYPDSWLYVKVPLAPHDREITIMDIKVDNSQPWQDKMFAQLQPYKKSAPYYHQVVALVKTVFEKDYDDIVSLNQACLKAVCLYLGIERELPIFSKMGLEIEAAHEPDEWALNICKAIEGVDEYWNPPGGMEFFNRAKYANAGITLQFQKPNLHAYDQRRQPFEPGLSIIDVMMFNDVETINTMLDDYELL